MLRYILIISFFLLVYHSYGQRNKYKHWYKGYVISATGDTTSGVVDVNYITNIIRIWDDSVERAFTPINVYKSSFFDQYLAREVTLRSFKYSRDNGYKFPLFFELVIDDQTDLFIREYKDKDIVYSRDPFTGLTTPYLTNVTTTEYYIRVRNNDIVYFSGGKKELLRILSDYQSAILTYIKKNSLRVSRKSDLIRIIKFFNQLQDNDS